MSGAGTPHQRRAGPLRHPPGLRTPQPRGCHLHGWALHMMGDVKPPHSLQLFGTAPARSSEDHH